MALAEPNIGAECVGLAVANAGEMALFAYTLGRGDDVLNVYKEMGITWATCKDTMVQLVSTSVCASHSYPALLPTCACPRVLV